MNMTITISGLITVCSFIITITAKLFSISSKYGALMARTESSERKNEEERLRTREKFDELYKRVNGHESTLAKLSSDVSSINSICCRLENKLDRIIESK